MTPTPCIENSCPRLVYRESRCKACYLRKHRERNASPKRSAYADGLYRRYREALRGRVCHLCGLPGSDTVDHLVPLSQGGGNDVGNLAPAHRACNSAKAAHG